MKTPVLPLVLALALAAAVPVARAEEGGSTRVSPADLEEKFYRAYYAENGLRDFAKAAEAYAEVFRAARSVGRTDLAVKALLGRARCTKTMGQPDETKAALAGVLEMDPENAEAKAAAAADAATTPDEDLRNRISHLILNGLTAYQGDMATSARELRLLGDRCLPVLAEALKEKDLGTVEAAATYVASLESPAASEILVRAMKDPEVLFRSAIAQAVCAPTSGGSRWDMGDTKVFSASEVPALAAAAEFPDPDIRRRVVWRLVYSGDPLGDTGVSLYLRLATDLDRSVRMAALEKAENLAEEPMLALVPALRRSLASEDAGERRSAVLRAGYYGRVRDLLLDALRPLLRDPDPDVRDKAFAALKGSLTEGDLASMLDAAEPALAAHAAVLLKERAPWTPDTTARVRGAIERAIRGEFGDSYASYFLELVLLYGTPIREPSSLVDIFARTGAPDARVRPQHLGTLRHNILQALRQPLRWDVSPQREQALAIVEEGVEKCLGSGGLLLQWVTFWADARVPASRAWIRAAGSDDARARTAAYSAILRSGPEMKVELPTDSLPHLGNDLLSPERETRTYALQLAERAPSPAIAEALRTLHAAAERTEDRQKLLLGLVAASGRAAEDAVRQDLASADPQVRYTALRCLMNEIRTGTREDLDAFVERGGDPGSVVGLATLDHPPDRNLLWRFARDLPQDRYSGYFVAKAAPFVDGADRIEILARALGSREPQVLRAAASSIGELRILELWPQVLTLLESGDHDVRGAAEKALAALKTYAELKTSLARFGKDEEAGALKSAEAMLASDDPVKRKGAVLALAALGDRSAIPAMLRALDDKDAGVREAALAALERLGGAPTAK